MRLLGCVCVILAAGIPAAPGAAQPTGETDAFLRVGVSRIRLADEGRIFVNGVRDEKADYKTPEKWVASAEVGYFVHDRVAVQVSGTTPATTRNVPAGSLDGLPNLGNDTFSIFTLTGTFHPLRGSSFSPYAGAGVGLQKVWSTEDHFASNLRIHDAFGAVIQGGVEVAVSPRFGVFFDAKKGFWDANASGNLGPARVTAVAKLDPLLLQAGALIRF
ncbi:MAG: outer membrane beta-barrel protein [Pseudomonadota bacterium]|nr:outer membrane beta-barrel protein [Pseudomonadota bacterium]